MAKPHKMIWAKLGKSLTVLNKVGCVFSMVVVSILPHAEFGPNDHQKDAPHFTYKILELLITKIMDG